MINRLLFALRWLAGCEPAAHKPAVDDLEPYCSEEVLQRRARVPLTVGTHKAIHKIGARYGAEL